MQYIVQVMAYIGKDKPILWIDADVSNSFSEAEKHRKELTGSLSHAVTTRIVILADPNLQHVVHANKS